ncbi:MAG: pyrimidine reductase family protein [Actinomycetes bacterium]
MRQLLPEPADDVDLTAAYAYPRDGRTWVRANMVSSVDGAAVVDGRSQGLSTPGDKKVFAALRGLADAVVVGAGTARTEGYRALRAKPDVAEQRASRGLRAAPVLVLVSGRLDLDPASDLFHGGAERTVVVTSPASDGRQRDRLAEVADVIVVGEARVDIAAAVDELAARGFTRLLCEGGPHLLGDVAASGRLDELCLTIAPRLAGDEGSRILAGPTLGDSLELAHLLEEDGALFVRYRRT